MNNDINRRVAEEIMGWAYTSSVVDYANHALEEWVQTSEGVDWQKCPDFYNSISDAFLVVEKMREKGFDYTFDSLGRDWCQASFFTEGGAPIRGHSEASSLPDAIIDAALKAIGEEI